MIVKGFDAMKHRRIEVRFDRNRADNPRHQILIAGLANMHKGCKLRLIHPDKMGIGKAAHNQIHFPRAPMPSPKQNAAAFGIQIQVPIPGFQFPELVGPFTTLDLRASAAQSVFDIGAIRRYQGHAGSVEWDKGGERACAYLSLDEDETAELLDERLLQFDLPRLGAALRVLPADSSQLDAALSEVGEDDLVVAWLSPASAALDTLWSAHATTSFPTSFRAGSAPAARSSAIISRGRDDELEPPSFLS